MLWGQGREGRKYLYPPLSLLSKAGTFQKNPLIQKLGK